MRKTWKILEKNGCLFPVLLFCTFFFLGGILIQTNYVSILYNSSIGFESEILVVDSVAYRHGGYKNQSFMRVFGKIGRKKNTNNEIALRLPESYNFDYNNQEELIGKEIPVWINENNFIMYRKNENTEFDIKPILKKMLNFFLIFNFPLILFLLIRKVLNSE